MSKPGSTEENLRVVRTAIEAYNAHDVARAIDCEGVSHTFLPSSPNRPPRSRVGDVDTEGRLHGSSRHPIQGRPDDGRGQLGYRPWSYDRRSEERRVGKEC